MPIRMQAPADLQAPPSAGRLPQFSLIRVLIFPSVLRGMRLQVVDICEFRSNPSPNRRGRAGLAICRARARRQKVFELVRRKSVLRIVAQNHSAISQVGSSLWSLEDWPRPLCTTWVIDDDLLLQSIMVQSAVTLGKVHLFAARIPREIGPHFVVETNRFDNERVSSHLPTEYPSQLGRDLWEVAARRSRRCAKCAAPRRT